MHQSISLQIHNSTELKKKTIQLQFQNFLGKTPATYITPLYANELKTILLINVTEGWSGTPQSAICFIWKGENKMRNTDLLVHIQ